MGQDNGRFQHAPPLYVFASFCPPSPSPLDSSWVTPKGSLFAAIKWNGISLPPLSRECRGPVINHPFFTRVFSVTLVGVFFVCVRVWVHPMKPWRCPIWKRFVYMCIVWVSCPLKSRLAASPSWCCDMEMALAAGGSCAGCTVLVFLNDL